jgi:DNA-binding NarL/FixJ family response regulator
VTNWARRILVVEDVPLTRSLIEALLVDAGFNVRVCTNATSAREIAAEFDPDLAMLDVSLGSGPSGVQLGYILERTHPAMAIMYLTRYPTAFLSEPGSSAHVKDKVILNKDDVHSPNDLLHAVETALRGYRTDSTTVGDVQMQRLTPLQWEILQLMASGMTNTAIAHHRGTSERAVERQLKLIYQALEIDSDQMNNARVLATRRYLETTGRASVIAAPENDARHQFGAY